MRNEHKGAGGCPSGSRPRRPGFGLPVGLVALSLALVPGAAFAEASASRQAMAEAMSRMMEAMGFLGSGSSTSNPMSGLGMPSPFGMPGLGLGMGSMPGMPFGGGQMDQYGQMGKDWMDRFSQGLPPGLPQGLPGMAQMPWSGSSLEGVWEGASGGLLIVQGAFYRLYAPGGGYVDGRIEISGQQLRMWSPEAGFDLGFEYAQDQGRMALRDQGGQLYLYRRLVLDGGGG